VSILRCHRFAKDFDALRPRASKIWFRGTPTGYAWRILMLHIFCFVFCESEQAGSWEQEHLTRLSVTDSSSRGISPQGQNDRTVPATLQAPRDLIFMPCNRLQTAVMLVFQEYNSGRSSTNRIIFWSCRPFVHRAARTSLRGNPSASLSLRLPVHDSGRSLGVPPSQPGVSSQET
jgi:hypothetical protein